MSDNDPRQLPAPVAATLRGAATVGAMVRETVGPALRQWGNRGAAALRHYFDGGLANGDASGAAIAAPGFRFEQVHVSFAGTVALQDISGTFAPGSMTAVTGPNGAGKSTLLKVAAGRLRPASGRVVIEPCAAHAIAFLAQRSEVDTSFPIRVLDFAALGAWRRFGALATPESEIAERARQALGDVGLSDAAGRFIGELSIGNLQRLLFARLLLLDAPCILLDEPFAAIDEATTLDLLAIMRRWHGEGRTIAAVLHDLDHVRDAFPDCLLLARRVVGWGATASVLTEQALRDARAALRGQ